jgi:hypothetical protein
MKTLDIREKQKLFQATAHNTQARMEFAQSRAEVINPLLETQSTVRQIFTPELLMPGATAVWDVPFEDIECVLTMPQIGAIPVVQVEGSELHVDTFGLDGGVEWQIDVAKDGRFNVAERATTLLKNNFIKQEELAGWGLIKYHASVMASAQRIAALEDVSGDGAIFGIKTLNLLMTTADTLGTGGRNVTDIYCSPTRFGDLRALVTNSALPEAMRQQIWGNGQPSDVQANIRIHRVYNSSLVSDTKIYAFTQKDGFTYGVMPIRDELVTMDNPMSIMEWKHGVIGRMRAGFGVLDSLGLIEITVS